MCFNCDFVAALQARGLGYALLGTFLKGASTLLLLSGSFSCPLHCYPSVALPFLAGLCLGFWLFWTFLRPIAFTAWVASDRPRSQSSRRLNAYLHE